MFVPAFFSTVPAKIGAMLFTLLSFDSLASKFIGAESVDASIEHFARQLTDLAFVLYTMSLIL